LNLCSGRQTKEAYKGQFRCRSIHPEEDLVVVFMAAAPGYAWQVLKGLVKNLVLASIMD
jgi:hypothetical protein